MFKSSGYQRKDIERTLMHKTELSKIWVFTAVTMKKAVFWDIKIQSIPHRRHITSPLQELSQLMLCKIWGLHGHDYEEWVKIPKYLYQGTLCSILGKEICYKPEGRWLETWTDKWFLLIYLILPAAQAAGFTQPLTEMRIRSRKIMFLGSKARLTPTANKFTAVSRLSTCNP
jgi:hypothetical protein